MDDLEIYMNAPEDPTPEELANYLDQACGDDQAQRQRLEKMFASKGYNEQFMEHSTLPLAEMDLRIWRSVTSMRALIRP